MTLNLQQSLGKPFWANYILYKYRLIQFLHKINVQFLKALRRRIFVKAFLDNVEQMLVIQIFQKIFGNKRLDNCPKICPIICYSKLFEMKSKHTI